MINKKAIKKEIVLYLNMIKALSIIKNKPEALFYLFFIKQSQKRKIIYRLKNGLLLGAPCLKRDRAVLQCISEIFCDEIYRIEKDESYKNIIDLGAHVGLFSLYSAMNAPNASIYSLEPDENSFRQLQENIFNNSFNDRIVAINKAVSSSCQKIRLFINQNSSRTNSTMVNTQDFTLVDSTNLEHLFQDLKITACDILKVDIEGAEYEVFYNCPRSLLKNIDMIFMECHDLRQFNIHYNQRDMTRYLNSLGFEITHEDKGILTAKNKRLLSSPVS